MTNVIQKHYRHLAKNYNAFLYYSPEFVRALTAKMIEKLRLSPQDTLVDLGCGTGMYSLDIVRQVPLKNPVIGVDPFAEMLAQIPEGAPIRRVCEDAVDFSADLSWTYEKVFIKETIHHVDRKEELFGNLHSRLPEDGVLLLVHVPPRVQYPLFRAALERCENWHADPDELIRLLQGAGFTVERDAVDYTHAIPRDHYFEMVRGCYMSVLTSFSEQEMEAGLEEMRKQYAQESTLEFTDHFDYLTASK